MSLSMFSAPTAAQTSRNLLLQAASAPLGILVQTDNMSSALSSLRRAKSEALEPAVQQLSLHRHPDEPERWIAIVSGSKAQLTNGAS